jgi:hypothetical protein
MLYVLYLKVNLLLVVAFEDDIYEIAFHNDQVLVYSREETLYTAIVLGIHKERLYRLLGGPIVWSNGYLDSTSYSILDSTLALEALS